MSIDFITSIFTQQGAVFLHSPERIQATLPQVKALLFDWDGVFTDGRKDNNRHSTFSELDTMGINMLRFSFFLVSGIVPFTAIITGEENPGAQFIAERDHFDAVYYQVKNKSRMGNRLKIDFGVDISESIFFFDDILDLSLLRQTAAGFALSNNASLLFQDYIRREENCAYISANTGASHGVREICELLIGLMERYEEVINRRSNFDSIYLSYLEARNKTSPLILDGSIIS